MKIVSLKDNLSEVLVTPSLGASILAYNYSKHGKSLPVFRSNLAPSSVLDTSNFPLVPFSNRIAGGKFEWLEKQVKLPLNHLPEKHAIHGHGWQNSWDIIEKSGTHTVLQYSHMTDEWPFPYIAKQRISLEDGMLHIELSIKNIGTSSMPVGLGLHPYFTRTKLATLSATVEQMWSVDHECMPIHLSDVPKDMISTKGMIIDNNVLDNAFTEFSNRATIRWPEWNAQADITTSDNCKFLVVYSPEKENFVCVEPVTHCTDAINMFNLGRNDTGIRSIESGEEMKMWMKISPKLVA